MLGQNFEHAATVYDRFIKLRPPAARLSEAWYRLAETQQALHGVKSAIDSYGRCIEIGGPFCYPARDQHALVGMRGKNLTMAEEMLDHNRELMGAEPDREAHEQTLYALAELLFLRREFYMAATRWKQALDLYPANPTALTARYRLAQCYRSFADRDS